MKLCSNISMFRYNTRERKIVVEKADMHSSNSSCMSYVESDGESDYLMKGLNWENQGDITHLPKAQQIQVKR